MADTRQLAHELIDRLPDVQLTGLVHFLETIIDPAIAALTNAPVEDEEISDEEQQAVLEAREEVLRNGGKGIPHNEAMRRLGLE